MTTSSKRMVFRDGELIIRAIKDRVYIHTDNDMAIPTTIYLSREELMAALSLLNATDKDQFIPFYSKS